MNRDDIIRMAHKAGLHLATDVKWMPIVGIEYAEKFAALVRADERDRCAKIADAHASIEGIAQDIAAEIRRFA
jgi:hypothetical protein